MLSKLQIQLCGRRAAACLLGINKDESIDISYLTNNKKEMFYSLLSHFRKYHYALDTLHGGGYVHPDEDYEEFYKSGS